MIFRIYSLAWRVFAVIALFSIQPALASEHGGSGAPAGPEPMQFTINVGKTVETMRVLQVTMVFEYAKPEIAKLIAEIKPKIQHRIILLLSGEDVATLQTNEGKLKLQEQIIEEINALIEKTPKSGIKEVFFTQFIIA